MKSSFKRKIVRRWRWWAMSTLIVLCVVLAIGYATITLVMGSGQSAQKDFLLLWGGIGIVVTFLLGQAVNGLLVRSWDTWIGDLGPTQIAALIPELERQKKLLEEEEEG